MNESYFQFYSRHPRISSPFGFGILVGMTDARVSPVHLPKVALWFLPDDTYCRFFEAKGFRCSSGSFTVILKTLYTLYTDDSKSASGVGFGVFFSSYLCLHTASLRLHQPLQWNCRQSY